ncbi:hypothetical protein BDZ97DRAFT_1837456, partial [Flammula alnicola]
MPLSVSSRLLFFPSVYISLVSSLYLVDLRLYSESPLRSLHLHFCIRTLAPITYTYTHIPCIVTHHCRRSVSVLGFDFELEIGSDISHSFSLSSPFPPSVIPPWFCHLHSFTHPTGNVRLDERVTTTTYDISFPWIRFLPY